MCLSICQNPNKKTAGSYTFSQQQDEGDNQIILHQLHRRGSTIIFCTAKRFFANRTPHSLPSLKRQTDDLAVGRSSVSHWLVSIVAKTCLCHEEGIKKY
mmetsp:Transcript_32212/g.52451  ORF Transcript_32212/g.52451 Transcript_32212/m.52451 type:complete len:99 (-) Transcript_32212:92-388(-)